MQQLLALYRPLMLKLAHGRIRGALRTKVAPSDLVQTTVWKVTQNFAQEDFADRQHFLTWLITILDHEAADLRRRYRLTQKRDFSRERPLFSRETQEWLDRLSVSLAASDGLHARRGDTIEELLLALERLPPHYRLVLRLRYFELLTYEAIAQTLDRSADSARMLHNRALKKLRDVLGSEIEHDQSP